MDPFKPRRRVNLFTKNSPVPYGNARAGQNLPSLGGNPPTPTGTGKMMSRGPRVLGGGATSVAGPGEPPAGFVGGTTSRSEWFIYWALEKLLGPEGVQWVFQESRQGGRHRLGGAVVDFIIYLSGLAIGVRVQTYRFHFNVDPAKQASDAAQLIALTDDSTIIIDIFEQQYIDDETGQAAIQLMLEVLNQRWRPNPLATGMVVGTG
jgi:hypothetical protein